MAKSCCNKACIVQGGKYRFSVLTPFMMRMEYSLQEQRLIPIRWNSKEKLHLNFRYRNIQ